MYCANCGAQLTPDDRFCGECGTPRPQPQPQPPPPPEPAEGHRQSIPPAFVEVEQRFATLHALYQAGQLNEAAYDAELQKLIIQDNAGGHWMIGADSGAWYWYDGGQWVRRAPPHAGVGATGERPPTWSAPLPGAAIPLSERLPWKWIALGGGGLLAILILAALVIAMSPNVRSSISTALQPPDADATITQIAADVFATQAAAATATPTATSTAAPTATPIPSPTPIPAPEPTPLLSGGIPGEAIEDPETGLAFHSHAVVRSEDRDGLLAFGELVNISDEEIDTGDYEVWFTLYDAAGQTNQSEDAPTALIVRPVLALGQKALFIAGISQDYGDIVDRAERYTVEVQRTGSGPSVLVELAVQEPSWNPGGEWTAVAVNDTAYTMERSMLFAYCAAYDAGGRLIHIIPAEPGYWFLAPGESQLLSGHENVPDEAAAIDVVAIGFPAQDLLFYDDFSDPDDGWETYSKEYGSVFFEDQALVFVAKGPDGGPGALLPDIEVQDFSLSFDVTPLSDPGDWSYGVIVRFVPGELAYLFNLTADGRYSVDQSVEREYTTIVDLTPSDAINVSKTNFIHIYAKGSTLSFYVNSEKLAEITDARALSGKIELWSYIQADQEVRIAIDNVVLREYGW